MSTIDLQTIRDNMVDLISAQSMVVSLIDDKRGWHMRRGLMASVCIAGVLMMAGCVSMGADYDPAAVEQLQPGMDKAAVVARLGRPTSTASLPDGKQQVMWIHSRGDMLGRGQARSVMLMFGADGKYIGMISQAETNLR